jgi:hypothetical protein
LLLNLKCRIIMSYWECKIEFSFLIYFLLLKNKWNFNFSTEKISNNVSWNKKMSKRCHEVNMMLWIKSRCLLPPGIIVTIISTNILLRWVKTYCCFPYHAQQITKFFLVSSCDWLIGMRTNISLSLMNVEINV